MSHGDAHPCSAAHLWSHVPPQVMLADIAPSSSSCEHTMNTLRYANRVKELRKGELLTFGTHGNQSLSFLADLFTPHPSPSAQRLHDGTLPFMTHWHILSAAPLHGAATCSDSFTALSQTLGIGAISCSAFERQSWEAGEGS
jgi:hypothetical protein